MLGRNNIITLTIPVVDRNVFSSCMYSVDDDLRYPDIINSEFSSNTITLDPDLKTDKISAVTNVSTEMEELLSVREVGQSKYQILKTRESLVMKIVILLMRFQQQITQEMTILRRKHLHRLIQ